MAVQALYTAATGMKALDQKLNVVANNLANVETVAFKSSRANFEDLLYQLIQKPGELNAQQEPSPTGVLITSLPAAAPSFTGSCAPSVIELTRIASTDL